MGTCFAEICLLVATYQLRKFVAQLQTEWPTADLKKTAGIPRDPQGKLFHGKIKKTVMYGDRYQINTAR